MSRLQSAIRRFQAQEILLDRAAQTIESLEGLILELGLGNGRTYDHLGFRLPKRRIIVFERKFSAPPSVKIAPENLILGELLQTGTAFAKAHPQSAALVHADLGSGDPERDNALLLWLPQLLVDLAKPDGIVLSGLPLSHPQLQQLPLPEPIAQGRYGWYRRLERDDIKWNHLMSQSRSQSKT